MNSAIQGAKMKKKVKTGFKVMGGVAGIGLATTGITMSITSCSDVSGAMEPRAICNVEGTSKNLEGEGLVMGELANNVRFVYGVTTTDGKEPESSGSNMGFNKDGFNIEAGNFDFVSNQPQQPGIIFLGTIEFDETEQDANPANRTDPVVGNFWTTTLGIGNTKNYEAGKQGQFKGASLSLRIEITDRPI